MKIFQTKGKSCDWGIVAAVVFLSAMGMLMVYSASSVYALQRFGHESYFLKRHTAYLCIGFAGMIVLMNLNYEILKKLAYPAYALGLALLVLVLVPGIGKEVGGARRWIEFGVVNFQSAEVAKFLLVFFLAHSFAKRKDRMDTFLGGFVFHLLAAGIYIALILLEPDFGMSAILLIMLLGMLFIGGARIKYLSALTLAGASFLVVAVLSEGYRMGRIKSFLDPWGDRLGSGYQAVQSFVAFAMGGVPGVGLGDSSQKLFFLPEAHTDFIFSIIGEELGFIGALLVIVAFVFFLTRGLRVAMKTTDLFGCYLVFGFTTLIALQAGVNMAVAVGLLPIKGLTLPFISYGGTSLVSSLAAIGVVLNVSRSGGR